MSFTVTRSRATPSRPPVVRRVGRVVGGAACGAALATLAACAQERALSIFAPGAGEARDQARLGWALLVVAAAVFVVFLAFLLLPLRRARRAAVVRAEADAGDGTMTAGGADGANVVVGGGAPRPVADHETRWIVLLGAVVPLLVLGAAFAYSSAQMVAHAAGYAAAAPGAPEIAVTGHQWWWEIRYPRDDVTTANELHVPVGVPVRLVLRSADVIHSFWVPRLGGKLDLVPGQANTLWLRADSAGTYLGQCAEYCGVQHAHMGLVVVAEPPRDYDAWLAAQRAPAAPPADDVAAGARVLLGAGCAACHTVRGTPAAGTVGPDLTHVASRQALAARTLPNTRGNLAGWLSDPQALKPGNHMPVVPLTGPELQALVDYLGTLR